MSHKSREDKGKYGFILENMLLYKLMGFVFIFSNNWKEKNVKWVSFLKNSLK